LIDSHPVEDPLVVDDLFLLRYLLSRKSTVKAAASAKVALEYRRNEEHLRMAQAIKAGSLGLPKLFWADPLCATTTSFGDVVIYIRNLTESMINKLAALEKGEFLLADKVCKEVTYQYLDFETRRRGHFVKCFMVLDYTYAIFSMRSFNLGMRLMPEIGKSSKLCQDLYPQMEAATVLANSSMLEWLVSVIKPFLPESSFEKIRITSYVPVDSIDGLAVREPIGTPCMTNEWVAVAHAFMRNSVDAKVCGSFEKQGGGQGHREERGCLGSFFGCCG